LASSVLACGIPGDLVPREGSQVPALPTSILRDFTPVPDADLVGSNVSLAFGNLDSFRWKEQAVSLTDTGLRESTITGEASILDDMMHGHWKITNVETGETIGEMEFIQSCCKDWIREPGQSWEEVPFGLYHWSPQTLILGGPTDGSVKSTTEEGRLAYILETHSSEFEGSQVVGQWTVLLAVDAETWLPLRASAQFRDSDGAITRTLESAFYDFNVPISIEPPQAAD